MGNLTYKYRSGRIDLKTYDKFCKLSLILKKMATNSLETSMTGLMDRFCN